MTNTDPANLTTNKNVQFYKSAHSFHIINKDVFVTKGHHWTFTRDDPHMIEMTENEYVDIDTEIEFELAEMLYIKNNGNIY